MRYDQLQAMQKTVEDLSFPNFSGDSLKVSEGLNVPDAAEVRMNVVLWRFQSNLKNISNGTSI